MIKKKIVNKRGESLAEVLIAILIIALGLVLLSSLIQVANNMMKSGNETINEIYNGAAAIESQDSSTAVTAAHAMTILSKKGTIINDIDIQVYKDEPSGLHAYGMKE